MVINDGLKMARGGGGRALLLIIIIIISKQHHQVQYRSSIVRIEL